MPRLVGVGNADTVQQRARFFGYKRAYLGYCRVYLESDAADAYRRYVTHEEDIREQMVLLRDRGLPLNAWKREFLLTRSLQPTRDNVLDLPYMRFSFGGQWYSPKIPHDTSEVTSANRAAVRAFMAGVTLAPDAGDERRTAMQRHLVATGLPLSVVYERLLTEYRVAHPSESQKYTSLLLRLALYMIDNPQATCTVYAMSRATDGSAVRERPVNTSGELTSYLFQGEHPASGQATARGSIYPGDVHLPSPDDVQVQIHHLRLNRDGALVEDEVPTLAIRLPAGIDDLVVQAQGGAP
jgi:hypothetical protein